MEGKKQTRAYRVRFRHSTCPTTAVTPADYKKFEFFFEPQQIWVRTRKKRMWPKELCIASIWLILGLVTFHDQSRSIYYDSTNVEEDPEAEEDINMTSSPETSPPSPHPPLDSGAGRETLAAPWTNAPQPDIQESAVTRSPSAHNLLSLASTATSRDIFASQAAREFQIEAGKAKECPFSDRSSDKDSVSCKFSSVKEAGLFRHYIEDLAPWVSLFFQNRITILPLRVVVKCGYLINAGPSRDENC